MTAQGDSSVMAIMLSPKKQRQNKDAVRKWIVSAING